MARTIAGELTLPDGSPLANAAIHFTAKRTEAVRILEDVSSFFTTSSTGAYSQDVEPGYYAVSVSYAAVPGTQPRRWHLGDVWVEDGDPISLTALLALNNSAADPTDSALRQLLADAQAARDEAQAAAQEAEQYRDETASMLDSKIDESEKGEPGGVATLDSGGRVPAAQLPSYVDDVEEYADYAALPAPGEAGKIYITIDNNRQYRWGGSDYIELVASPGTTDNVPEGSSNLYHTAARVRSVVLSGISFASSAAITASDTILSAFGKIQAKLNTLKAMAFLDKASQAQAEAGESDAVGMTPLGVKRYVDQWGLGTFGNSHPEVANVDDAKTAGNFRIPPSALGDHPWPNISSTLYVGVASGSYVEQIAIKGGSSTSSGSMEMAFRHFNGSEWSEWQYTWHSGNLPQSSIDNWNTAYSWGNHADAGYLTSVSWGDVEGKPAVIAAGATAEEARAAIGFDSVSPATPANGGLLVDNRKTGTGLERVLTESDLSTSGLPNVQSAAPEDGGLLVDNQKTGTGLERVLTESDLSGSGGTGVGVDQVPLNGDLIGRFTWGKNLDSDPTPPRSSAEWPDASISIASAEGWGSHDVLYAKQILRIGGSYALLYQSRHNGFMTASLAFSTDLKNWLPSPLNPIFSEVTYSWQGDRAMPEQLVYDDENHRWILIICGNGGAGVPGQGIRAIGAAYSEDLVSWTLEPDPIVLVEDADILQWAPGSPVDRVYCHGIVRKDGWWYMIVNAGGDVAGQRHYKTGVIRSKSITGPWEGVAANPVLEGTPGGWDEATINLMSPIFFNGRWWAAYNSTGGAAARRTLGLAWTDDLTSKWEKSAAPIWQGADAESEMDRPVLFPTEDGWGVIAGKRIAPGGDGELLLVYSTLAGQVLPGRSAGGGAVAWVPVISSKDGSNPAVAQSATGYIVRNGDVVTLSFDIQLSSVGAASGDVHINGIPDGFEPLKAGHGTLNIGRTENISLPSDAMQLTGWITTNNGLTQLELRYITSSGETAFLKASDLTSTTRIFGSCTYISAPN